MTSALRGGKLRKGSRLKIYRGFFHRENRILLRKSQIFDLDTILYSMYNFEKCLKNRTF